jgi:uncharacterized protein with PIN domain
MICSQCGAETKDDEWNCVSCRVNMYWAARHYEALARIREDQGLPARAGPSLPFLVIQYRRI